MPGKMIACSSCTKMMRSDNLKRHKRTCPEQLSKIDTSLHSSGDSAYSHLAESSQYNKKWPENDINADISLKTEESEPMIKQIKLSVDGDSSTPSTHSMSHDELDDIDDDDDVPLLTESELEEVWGRFKKLHHELINKRLRENITELNKILQIRLEEKMINHTDYMKAINAINKDYLATYL